MAHYQAKHARTSNKPRQLRRIAALVAVGGLCGTGLYFLSDSRTSTTHRRVASAKVAAAPTIPSPPPAVETLDAQLGFAPSTTAGWVIDENAKLGTAAWHLTKPATDHQIEGFADTVSVEPGQTLNLYVSTTEPDFHVDAYRMGYYGGALGRSIWSSAILNGVKQPRCALTASTNTVRCSWTDPVAVSTGGWTPGDYLFKLTSSSGWQSYIPLTVRDDSSHSAYLVDNSVTTWQAYNLYGGRNLYAGPTSNGHTALTARARIVSFDRPYTLGDGAGDFVSLELAMVATMESLGLDVSYTTDVDASIRPQLLLQHRTFITLGHDEYWTLAMRQGVTAARDAGVNLIFLGANAAYRHIRLQPSTLGPDREEIDYKDPHADPLLGKDNADVTPWAWRDWPNNAPESALLGEMWECNPVQADMVISDASSWLFEGTGLRDGSHIPNIVGSEFDRFNSSALNPGDVAVVARSPVRCGGQRDEADMTYYSAASGAGVWDTGTIEWVGSVVPFCATCHSPGPVTTITVNVLAAFGVGPAGRVHPSSANVVTPGGRSPASGSRSEQS